MSKTKTLAVIVVMIIVLNISLRAFAQSDALSREAVRHPENGKRAISCLCCCIRARDVVCLKKAIPPSSGRGGRKNVRFQRAFRR